ncbi:hypothetical protein GYMLUDRAFT_154768 [Collybiopsis luxurians FD-317 M1]|nr:hypothetical protein GYMLUDRAFT_154768 [Collybiopsis luxurians FD-317 M1]
MLNHNSDDDEPLFGKQILPVADLPDDFDGVPGDGLQYLFTVRSVAFLVCSLNTYLTACRRDARLLPHITRVPNPYQTLEPVHPPSRSVETMHPSLPSPEWRNLFEIRFRNLRKNILQSTHQIVSNNGKIRMPDIKDRAAWWEFLAGKPESIWNRPKKPKTLKQKKYGRGMRAFDDDPQSALDYSGDQDESSQDPDKDLESPPKYKPIAPTPLLLGQLDDRMALHLLMYFTYWINQHLSKDRQLPFPRLSETQFQWVFALLTRVDDYISADDMNLLRNLTRACIALLKVMMHERASQADKDALGDETSCWMIISVVIGIWGQRDLWTDAEDMVKGVCVSSS